MTLLVRLVLLSSLLLAVPALASESIDFFDVQIDLQRDSSFVVTETIVYEFGSRRKHGIYRDIPLTHYRGVDTGFGQVPGAYRVRLHMLGVGDQKGVARPYKVIHNDDGVRIRIGSANTTVTGTQVYKIQYVVQRAINYFDEWDEFYWNATGHQWKVPIRRTQVQVYLPGENPPPLVKAANFVGYLGSQNSVLAHEVGGSYSVRTESLRPGQGVTLVLALEKEQLHQPSRRQRLSWFLTDNFLLVMAILLPLFTLILLSVIFWYRGRDPESHLPIMVQYKAPKDLNPAEMGTLLDEVAHTSDIVSTVLDLAARGYLKIREIETRHLLFFTNTDYEFCKVKEPDEDLNTFEKTFMSHLLDGATTKKLSDLKEKFYVHLPDLQKKLYKSLVSKKMFPLSPDKIRVRYAAITIVGLILIGVLVVLIAASFGQAAMAPAMMVSVALSCGIALLFSRVMPRKTLRGSQTLRHCKGFQEFLTRTEQDRIKRLAEEDPQIFGRLLPFAVVLGCADQWAEKFEDLLTEPPDWYISHRGYGHGTFRTSHFVNDLGQSMNSMANSFSSRPQSSGGGSGSSGFSSGGGFSGGGFGGGGGGSW